MIRDELRPSIESATKAATDAGALPQVVIPDVVIERPARPEHGDYACSVSMRLARAARSNPVEIAKAIAANVAPHPAIEAVDVAPPGFINFRLAPAWLAEQVD